jgi:adenosylhomocysteine nucleosidase
MLVRGVVGLTRTRFKRGDVSATVTPAISRFGETGPLFGTGQVLPVARPRAYDHQELRDRPVLAVTGLLAEARVAAGPGIMVVSSGGDVERLEAALDRAVAADISAIISFGIAGGLAPGLPPGSALVARTILTENGDFFESDRAWSRRLSAALGGVPMVDIVGVDAPVTDPRQKRALHTNTGAAAVDMESHVAARVAHIHGLPFAAFRVIADPAERHLPHAAVVGMRPDGKLALGALLRSLLREPRQLPQLARTALDASAAFAALLRSRKMLAAGLSFGDFSELLLDVPREDVVCGSLPI